MQTWFSQEDCALSLSLSVLKILQNRRICDVDIMLLFQIQDDDEKKNEVVGQ